jgi:hypothetical protein
LLSLYLFHVSPDKFQRNAPVTGPFTPPPSGNPTRTATRVPRIPFQPLSLDLYYLLTAHSDAGPGAFIQEQQVISMALKCFHEHPIVFLSSSPDAAEFCLTMEIETADELGRLWQAVTSPVRLSAIYKASVVFIEPPTPPALSKQVEKFTLAVDPTTLPFPPMTEQVFGTFTAITYTAPKATAPFVQSAQYELFPATVALGQDFLLHGVNFKTDPPAARDQVFLLLPPPALPLDISSWVDWTQSTASKLFLTVQSVPALPPGVYQINVGTGAFRSNATPISIAAAVDPTGGPVLPTAVTYSFTGQGFVPGSTEVLLDTVSLTPTGGVPSPGEFALSGNTITFQLPTNLPNGQYALRVRVNHIESSPVLWVRKP